MTEKRFRCEGAKIFDGEELFCCTLSIWAKQLVDLLNELNDENEHLKHDATVLIYSNHDYRKENEQLEQQISRINQLIDKKIDEFKNGDYGDLPCNTIHMFLDLKQEIGDVE